MGALWLLRWASSIIINIIIISSSRSSSGRGSGKYEYF